MLNPFYRFDSIYCINLEERKDRWEECEKIFAKYDIPNVQRFNAIKINNNNLNRLQCSRLGCALSIYSIIETAYNNNKLSVLILEDDFYFINSIEDTHIELDKQILSLPNDWCVLMLGANLHEGHSFPIKAYSENLVKVISSYTTHSFSLSRYGMKLFLDHFKDKEDFSNKILNHYGAIDVFFATDFLRSVNSFIGKTLLTGQRADISDIEGWYANYTPSMLARFNHYMRLI